MHHLLYNYLLVGLSLCLLTTCQSPNSEVSATTPSSEHEVFTLHQHGNTYCGVPPTPDLIELIQPDGSTFEAYLFVEGPSAYLETPDGYTLLQDSSDDYYRYATRGSKGDLFLTGVPVSAVGERNATELTLLQQVIRPHLRYEGTKLAALMADDQLKNLDDGGPGVSAVFPPAGIQKALLLLIDFPDQAFTYPTGDFDNLANQVGYSVNGASGSFRDYYLDISYGLLTVNTDVEGWYTADSLRATYGVESMANRNFQNAVPLIREAVDAAEAAGIDFSQYDGDGDNRVDVVEIIHSGRGAEESGNVADIWSHRWVLSAGGLSVTYDGKLINDYIIQPEKYGSTNISNIGVFVHEFGHALGLPDLYDIDGSSRGIGRWCCMAGGTWNNSGRTPAQFSAWCKEQLGWTEPTVLSGTGSITDMDYSDNSDEAYRFDTETNDEYFLLENRKQTGWDTYISGEGLAIYHIDNNLSNNSNENHPLVDLEQADGDRDMNNNSNSGDNGDLYPGSSNNTDFDCLSTPSSEPYNGASILTDISNIVLNGDLISFDYSTCSPSCSIANIQITGDPTDITATTYTQSFTVSYSSAPGIGTLEVSAAGVSTNVAITSSPQTVTINGLPTNGNTVNVSASFSELMTCSVTSNNLYTAPLYYGNDDICDALDITANIDGAAVLCHNFSATSQASEPLPNGVGCSTQNGWCTSDAALQNSVWFQFDAPASGSIDIDFNTAIDLQMALWEADQCSDLLNSNTRMMVAANDDSGTAGGYSPLISNQSCLVPGKTYYLQVDGWRGTSSNFSIAISDPGISCSTAPNTNGDCMTDFTATSTGNGEWIHLTDGSGQRIASVNDMFNNLGEITLSYNLNSGPIRKDANDFPLLDRDWFINVANNNAATVRLYLTDTEFQNLVDAGAPGNLDEIKLRKVSGGTCGDYSTGSVETLDINYSMEGFSGTDHLLEYQVSGFSGFFPRSNVAILPIELKYFRGEAQDKSNLLTWASSLEENTKVHEIERLLPNETEWEQIGNTAAAGDSQTEVTYRWEDAFPLPKAYYRLKTVDLDGSFQYSDIILIERAGVDFQLTRTFPNPTRTTITSEYYSNESTELNWRLVNANGQVVQQGLQTLPEGRSFLQVDLSDAPAGLYFLLSGSGEEQLVRKVIKE